MHKTLTVPLATEPITIQVHRLLGEPLPCQLCGDFEAVWAAVIARLPVATHQDGSRDLGEVFWTLVRHLRPIYVVETGVAQGISTAVCLSALAQNGDNGHLWSIDLPPLRRGWHGQTAAAVSEDLRDRWTYVEGAARRILPSLAARLPSIDLFAHDGLHTYNNMMRDFRSAWRVLPNVVGCLLADDVHANPAFGDFATSHTDRWAVISGVGVALRPTCVDTIAGRRSLA